MDATPHLGSDRGPFLLCSCGEPNGCSLTKAVIAKPALCVASLLIGIYYFNNLLYLLRHLVLGLIGRVSPIHPCVLQLHW